MWSTGQLSRQEKITELISGSKNSFHGHKEAVLRTPNASVNSSSAHAPRVIVGHFPTLSIPGVGH